MAKKMEEVLVKKEGKLVEWTKNRKLRADPALSSFQVRKFETPAERRAGFLLREERRQQPRHVSADESFLIETKRCVESPPIAVDDARPSDVLSDGQETPEPMNKKAERRSSVGSSSSESSESTWPPRFIPPKENWDQMHRLSWILHFCLVFVYILIMGYIFWTKSFGYDRLTLPLLYVATFIGFVIPLEEITDQLFVTLGITYSKRFVAFGEHGTKYAWRYLLFTTFYLTAICVFTMVFHNKGRIPTFDLVWLLCVNIADLGAQILVRFSASKYYHSTTEEQMKEDIKAATEQLRALSEERPWSSYRMNWFKLGVTCYILFYGLMSAVHIHLFYLFFLQTDNTRAPHHLWVCYTLFVILFFIELIGDIGDKMRIKTRVLIKKRFVAFGDQSTMFSRYFFNLNVFMPFSHGVMAIMNYRWKESDANDLASFLILDIATVTLQVLIRVAFSKFYNMTTPEELNDVIKNMGQPSQKGKLYTKHKCVHFEVPERKRRRQSRN